MTAQKHFKRLVRERMGKTGESFAVARSHVEKSRPSADGAPRDLKSTEATRLIEEIRADFESSRHLDREDRKRFSTGFDELRAIAASDRTDRLDRCTRLRIRFQGVKIPAPNSLRHDDHARSWAYRAFVMLCDAVMAALRGEVGPFSGRATTCRAFADAVRSPVVATSADHHSESATSSEPLYRLYEVFDGPQFDPLGSTDDGGLHSLVMEGEKITFDSERRCEIVDARTGRIVCEITNGDADWLDASIPRRLGWQRSPIPY